MRPGVAAELVAVNVLLAENVGLAERTRANDVKGGLEVVVTEVVEQNGRVDRRSVVKGQAPGVLLGALDDVGLVRALALRERRVRRALAADQSATSVRP